MSEGRLTARFKAIQELGRLLEGSDVALDELGWRRVAELAREHGLGPALWASVSRRRVPLSTRPPVDVAEDLTALYRGNVARQILFRRQLRQALGALNEMGIEPAPIKGSLYLLENTFADVGARVMVDLDLIVTDHELVPAVDALARVGYRRFDRPAFSQPHEVPMAAGNQIGAVELHTRLGVPAVTDILPTDELLEASTVVCRDGLRFRRPRSDHLLIHHVLHGQIQDRNHKVFGLPLRQLSTFVVIARAWAGELDWIAIVERFEARGLGAVLGSYVDLAHDVFGFDDRAALNAQTHRPLQLAARRAACLANGTLGWPSHVARNLGNAFAADYLRDRYDDHTPLLVLRGRHAATLWRERRSATIGEASRQWM